MMHMVRAIIFDFDGVIVDTEPLHYRAFSAVLQEMSIPLAENDYFNKYLGLNDRALLGAILDDAGRTLTTPERNRLLDNKNRTYFAAIAHGMPRRPGVDAFVARVARRWPLAVCSGARRVEIETILRQANLLDHFHAIVSADDVAASKPDPTGFLTTLEMLHARIPDLQAHQCLVIEDSPHGITAARAAGMRTLAVRASSPAPPISGADDTVPDLSSVDDGRLAAIVSSGGG